MINKIAYIETDQTIPYHNLALEEQLLKNVEVGQCILYLWQNKQTVVIGHNQNAWKECQVSKLLEDGGYLVRRLSGGGAVFHDMGNLNFTFLVRKEDYDLNKQLDVILKAVQKLGLHAEKSGRNDILVDGKKFSGNAYFETEGHCYHHGTIMVNVNLPELSKYLSVSKDKLVSKGVDSVQSRVMNLSQANPDITIKKLKGALQEAFSEVYKCKLEILDESLLDQPVIEERANYFSSWDTIFGKKITFQHEIERRFEWGNMQLQMEISKGMIQELNVFSDALVPWFMDQFAQKLKGQKYQFEEMKRACEQVKMKSKQEECMLQDIIVLLKEMV